MKLAWKEYRETLPILLLAVGLVTFFALRPVFLWAGQDSIVEWQLGLKQGGTAILFFVALVIGVLTYAIEEEQGTLQPLLAHPVTESDVFRTKVQARGMALLAALVYFLVLQILTGAWNAGQPVRGSLTGAAEWLATVAQVAFGFSIGLYFGKRMGAQTRALVASALVFAGLWVLVAASPLKELFLSPRGGYRFTWVRDIVLPALAAAGFFLLSARATGDRRPARLTPTLITSVALVAYGLIIWVSSFWLMQESPRTVLNYLRDTYTLYYGSPTRVLGLVEEGLRYRDDLHASDRRIFGTALSSMVRSNVRGPDEVLLEPAPFNFYRTVQTGYFPPEPIGRGRYEQKVLETRGSEWIREQLEAGREAPVWERLILIHLAALSQDPSLLDDLRPYLGSDEPKVRGLTQATFMTFGRPEGMEGILDAFRDDPVSFNPLLALPEEARPLMLENLDSDSWTLRGGARFWLMTHGSMADLERVHSSILEVAREQRKDPTYAAQNVDMSRYILAWSGPDRIPVLRAEAEEEVAYFESHRMQMRFLAMALDSIQTAARRGNDRDRANLLRDRERTLITESGIQLTRLRSLEDHLHRLGELRDPSVVDFYRRIAFIPSQLRSFGTQLVVGSSRAAVMFPLIRRVGPEGLTYLREVAEGLQYDPQDRFQAAALLVDAGEDRFTTTMLGIWQDAVGNGRRSLFARPAFRNPAYWTDPAFRTLLALIRKGNMVAAGSLIQNAVANAQIRPEPLYDYMSPIGMGAWFWNVRVVEALEEGSGRHLGWSLPAWRNWWIKEQRALLAGPSSRAFPRADDDRMADLTAAGGTGR